MKAPASFSSRKLFFLSILWLAVTMAPLASAQSRGQQPRRGQAVPLTQTGPEQVLYAFQGGSDGADPSGSLIFDSSGNLYGVTQYGGEGTCSLSGLTGCGTVFELSPNGSGGWTETILYKFPGGSDGELPTGALIFDSAGNLYGTTQYGGSGPAYCFLDTTTGCGTVFELSPNGSGGWTENVLYSFGTNGINDGEQPQAPLIFDGSGNLYGTTLTGGNSGCDHDGSAECGTVFELSPNGSGGWTETIIYAFPSGDSEGYSPNAGLVFDQSGNSYGTTQNGGAGVCMGSGGCGTVFELSPNGGGSWMETVLYSFQALNDGYYPNGGLIFDQSGNLYGTVSEGSGAGCNFSNPGCGAAFELSPNGSGGWTETTLYAFGNPNDANSPLAGLIFDQSGSLYGTTGGGGRGSCSPSQGCGTVFELSPNGSGGWAETVLYSFQGGNDGSRPEAGVIFDQTGHIYGTTPEGGGTGCGGSGCGIVYELSRGPAATFSPVNLSFGNQNVGTTSGPQVVALINSGSASFTISSIQITGANSSDFAQTNNCPASLAPNGSCNIDVTFTPAIGGNASASVSVTDTALSSPQTAPLSGTGLAPVTFSPSSVSFPAQYVGTSGLPQNVTLTNTGTSTITITSATANPSSDFSALSACPNSLAPGTNCSIGVFFDPSAGGTRSGTLTVVDSAPGGQQIVPLAGSGEDFSMVASSPSQTVSPGQIASYSVSVSPLGGFNQTVQLSCSGAPSGASCSVSPSTATLNGSTSQTVKVTVTTAGMAAGVVAPAGIRPSKISYGLWLGLSGILGLAVWIVPVGFVRRRSHGSLCALTLLCLLTMLMPACGGGSSSSTGLQAGTYSLTVTGTFTSGSTNLTHKADLTLQVQ